ncbi:hypothetical protein B0A48_10918 [Cryoendolithus antarcticus]|uniref:Uncharacterized protein n=1 Tax=Cryoendolithus antarcticus TaxID=1507870 RepID=A0A1V8SYR9_9PEZI|nr:hypothetical protein B0A48_10918 [Cryoendolithus antarcticus]
MLLRALLLLPVATVWTAPGRGPPHGVHYTSASRLNATTLAKQYFGNDAPWYHDRIPYFECSDKELQDVYYYRWKIFRAHQRDLGARGYISTEFLDDVSWQLEPWASLNDATGFHIGEGRWSRDRRFSNDYINHMYNGGNDRHFTDYMADSTWSRYLVDGDASTATQHIDAQKALYGKWNDHLNASVGLYYIEPLLDATEYTISSIDASGGKDGFTGGNAFRPSINSYMWANALGIANAAQLAGQVDVASTYRTLAATLKTTFQRDIWNTTLEHFIDRYQVNNQYVTFFAPIRGRELVGFVPWMFGMPDDTAQYSAAWKHILSTNELLGAYGLRTNEPSFQYYMRQYRYDGATGLRECQWNGPVWPFQTTQVLLAQANVLNDYIHQTINTSTYMSTLRTYANLHYLPGTTTLDLQEDYEPDKPGPIVGLPRSHHYFHSGFIDVIISGLVGIRPQANDSIVLNPLVDSSISYFCLQNVAYHGHNLTVTWDATGSHYNRGVGLSLEVDGRAVASSTKLSKLTAPVSRLPAASVTGPIVKSVQLYRNHYPMGSASSANLSDPKIDIYGRNTSEAVHDVVDGRIWFFPELINGYNYPATTQDSQQWFAIDFGSSMSVSRAEIAVFEDGSVYAAPQTYWIEIWDGAKWVKVKSAGGALIGNGVTQVSWTAVQSSKLRVVFVQSKGKMKFRITRPSTNLDEPFAQTCKVADDIPGLNDLNNLASQHGSHPGLARTRENATILMLARNSDVVSATAAIRSLEEKWNRWYHYPIVFLNDKPWNSTFINALRNATESEVFFEEVPESMWSWPKNAQGQDVPDRRVAEANWQRMADAGLPYAKAESYHHMCRFFSGFFFDHPAVAKYRYYWRVEPDVDFTCKIPYDPFRAMRLKDKIYGYTMALWEVGSTCPSLFRTTADFKDQHVVPTTSLWTALLDASWAPAPLRWYLMSVPSFFHSRTRSGDAWNQCHFWSNFEIADMDFFRSEQYRAYFAALDKAGGFFTERWGDAPVHSLALAMFAKPEQLHWFEDIGIAPATRTASRAANPDTRPLSGAREADWEAAAVEWPVNDATDTDLMLPEVVAGVVRVDTFSPAVGLSSVRMIVIASREGAELVTLLAMLALMVFSTAKPLSS